MKQEEHNKKTYESAQLQLIEMRIQWEEERRDRDKRAEALAQERSDAHTRWEIDNARTTRHWNIGYLIAFGSIVFAALGSVIGISMIYLKLTQG